MKPVPKRYTAQEGDATMITKAAVLVRANTALMPTMSISVFSK